MKKLLVSLCFIFFAFQAIQAQVQFGIKGGVNYNSDSFENVVDDVFSGAKSKTGFHLGIWTRFKIPVIGIQLRPELMYTKLRNQVTYTAKGTTTTTKTNYDFKKIDIPVLIEKNIFRTGRIFAGPSFQFVTGADFEKSLNKVKLTDFTMGLQLGAGIEFSKIGIDVRWERSLGSLESTFIDVVTNENVNFDTRINQIIVGLSYKF